MFLFGGKPLQQPLSREYSTTKVGLCPIIDVLIEEDKQWISERLEKVETTLLTEFHKWASPVELRQKSHAAAIRALDTEVEALSDRLKNLQGR